MNLKLIPLITSSSSIESLVVPAISLTIAFSSFKIEFSRVDLPVFGSPTMDIGIPSLITLPSEKESIRFFKVEIILTNKSSKAFILANSTSSSEKSSSNSINDAKFNSSSLKSLISLLNPPRM